MRFALDACVTMQLAAALRALGADVVSAVGRPATPDEEVIAGAFAQDRVLVTSDTDFGELVFRSRHAAVGIILLRYDFVAPPGVRRVADRIMALPAMGRGAFTVLEAEAMRSRPLPEA